MKGSTGVMKTISSPSTRWRRIGISRNSRIVSEKPQQAASTTPKTIAIFEEFGGPPIGGLVAPASMGAYLVIDVLVAAYAAAGTDINAMTEQVIRDAALAYTGPLTLGPDVFSCPGADPFVGLCNSSATVVQLEGDTFNLLTDWYVVDVEPYAALLEG